MEQIPERHQEFIKKIVEFAKEHGISEFSGQIKPFTLGPCGSSEGFDPWHENIKFSWSQGRHGEPANIFIESTAHICVKV